uniref:NADH-ubiquinone oxidoreductase chain 3 n=1 Tax=Ocnus glacialis TaxID=3074281 RepID=A0AA51UD64_9ECHN|nr:NADH dehydrogenase subunit 3 [Ocnus glacialis]WMW14031.1 NADH dehydrogenase subunit 3 [Ocnus glacialis]
MNLIISSIIIIFLSALLLLVGHIIPTRNFYSEKNTPYECGFDPINSARLPFSFRFFLIAILFIIFDLEIALIFPILASLNTNIAYLLFFSTIFIIILTGGLWFEWHNGGLEWAN